MRFASIIVSGMLAVLASAADGTASEAATSVSLTPAQSSLAACLASCGADDINCRSHCVTVPSPNQSQVMQTTECAAKCNQGDGSAGATDNYAKCVQACIQSNFYTTSFGTPEQTAAAAAGSGKGDSGSGSDSGSSSSSGSGSSSGSSSGKGDGSSASGSSASKTAAKATGTKTGSATSTPTDNAAPFIAGSAMLGLLGAVLAL